MQGSGCFTWLCEVVLGCDAWNGLDVADIACGARGAKGLEEGEYGHLMDARALWTSRLVKNVCNMALAATWSLRQGFLSQRSIGALGVIANMIDLRARYLAVPQI